MLMVHDEPAVIDAGQSLEAVKSPVAAMLDILSPPGPLFERTSDVAAPVVATR